MNVGLLAAFAAGLVSFLSPCVAPLLPGYVTMLSGAGTSGSAASRDRMRLFWPSLTFVLGFSLVFVSLGASASVFGEALEPYRRDLTRFSGLVMIIMGLVILSGSHIPFLMRERRFHFTPRRFTHSEIVLLGMAFGFGWTPCIGPILASILAYTSTADTVRQGTMLLLAYSLGLGLPFLLVGLGLSQFHQFVRGIARHGRAVTTVSGATLVIVGALFVTGQMFRFAIAGQRLLGLSAG